MQLSKSILPTFYNIALNNLPIHMSLVPSECIFSSSVETDMKGCNHIHPVLMEVLQMLKFTVKESCLDFMKNWVTLESTLLELEPDTMDLLASLM